MLDSALGSNTEDKYIHEFYEAHQMCILKEFQICYLPFD